MNSPAGRATISGQFAQSLKVGCGCGTADALSVALIWPGFATRTGNQPSRNINAIHTRPDRLCRIRLRFFRRFHCKSIRQALRRLCPHRGVQQIAAARHRLDQAAVVVAELMAQFPNALHERVIGHRHVWPHRLIEFLLGHEPPGVLCEVAQHLERLGPQVDLLIARTQASSRQIEHEAVELQNSVDDMVHSPLR